MDSERLSRHIHFDPFDSLKSKWSGFWFLKKKNVARERDLRNIVDVGFVECCLWPKTSEQAMVTDDNTVVRWDENIVYRGIERDSDKGQSVLGTFVLRALAPIPLATSPIIFRYTSYMISSSFVRHRNLWAIENVPNDYKQWIDFSYLLPFKIRT